MTPVEACKALNENSVNAVRRLAEHMGVDPVGLSERLARDILDWFEASESEVLASEEAGIGTRLGRVLSSLRGDQ